MNGAPTKLARENKVKSLHSKDPTDRVERKLFAEGHEFVAGIDEVGRGAWAGPLTVGIAVVTRSCVTKLPKGLRDSKLLSPDKRAELFEPLREAVFGYGIGHASPKECDAYGMTKAQKLATRRALRDLGLTPDICIMDGIVDFTERAGTVLMVGADRITKVVAAASVLAKVTRDRLMIDASRRHPGYGFDEHKGYICPSHRAAVRELGASRIHRHSWNVSLDAGAAEEELPALVVGAL